MNAVEEPLPRLLERVSRHAGLRIEIEAGVLVARLDEPVLRTYPIDYVPLARETETVNEVGTGVGGGIEAPAGEENGSAANVKARTEHRFWDAPDRIGAGGAWRGPGHRGARLRPSRDQPHRGANERGRPSRGGAPPRSRSRQRPPPGPDRGDDRGGRARRPISGWGRPLASHRRRRIRVQSPRRQPRRSAPCRALHPRSVADDSAPLRIRGRPGALHPARHGSQQPDRDREDRREPGVLHLRGPHRDERDLGRAKRPDQAAHGPGRAHPSRDPFRRGRRRNHPEDSAHGSPARADSWSIRTRSLRRPGW